VLHKAVLKGPPYANLQLRPMSTNDRVITVLAPDGFEWRETPAGPALVCHALEPYAAQLFTTRQWALGSTPDGDRRAAWADVAGALGVDVARLERAHQVHGASVVVRRAGDPPRGDAPLPDADIIVSDDPAIVLSVQTADCVPLLIADRRTGAVAAAHAGWRGLAARVPEVAVQALSRAFGSRAADLVAGPPQLARWFVPSERPGHWYFDGWTSAREQLEASGVPADRIHLAALCTASHPDLLCSYRRDGKAAGRIAGAIRALPRRP
jgi:copper oxidase (laccase) domain-containing protein